MAIALLWMAGLSAQNETSKWYFGNAAAMDFQSGAPVTLTNSAMSVSEGSASIAGPAGNLLFYTHGSTIWNANHVPMPNGTGLFGSNISCQSAVIVRQPGSANLYYVFTQRNWTDPGNGAHYSIVDMSLNAGLGDVTVKNQLIYGNTRESLTAVCHTNGVDEWIVIHDMFTNEFRSYLLTAAGLSAVPVISAVGSVFTGGNRYGALKSSPDGTRLAYALGGGSPSTEIYDFSRSTGTVSNPLTLNNGAFTNAYGVEFSPNSQLLYVAEYNGANIQQFNLAAGTPALILGSNTVISTGLNTKANLQLGPDNKIYVCLAYQAFMGRINNPDVVGIGANYVNNAVDLLGRSNNIGIPNFMPCLIPIILPRHWTFFTAEANAAMDRVELHWGMEDADVVAYHIERKGAQDPTFLPIAHRNAFPHDPSSQAWTDASPAPGLNAYRIAAAMRDGTLQYSEIQTIQLALAAPTFTCFPNPAHASFTLQPMQNLPDQLAIQVHDLLGQTVYQAQWDGKAPLQIDAQDWPSGLYLVAATTGHQSWRQRLVID